MVLDTLENLRKYSSLHPGIATVCDFLDAHKLAELTPGRIELDGKDLYINVDEATLRTRENAYPEVHDEYIDIQIPLSQDETMGYMPRTACHTLREVREGKDTAFYEEKPDQLLSVKVGMFVIFFPQDAHAPIIGEGTTRKIVVKLRIK